MQISDMRMILDFQKKNGYVRYVSPQMAAYKEEYKSRPEGYWIWGAIGPAGLAYNPNVVPADQAPNQQLTPQACGALAASAGSASGSSIPISTTRP